MTRTAPVWWGPMKAAEGWVELGADSRELALLRYWSVDRPDHPVKPYRLPFIRLTAEGSTVT